MNIIPKKNTKCSNCIWAVYLETDSLLGSGYLCKLNPFKTVAMGLRGIHSQRKTNIKDDKLNKGSFF